MIYRRCPICNALDIVGDKWSLLVIRDLLGGKTTFKDFMNGPEKNCFKYFVTKTKMA